MRAVAVTRDLIIASRIEEAARRGATEIRRVDDPDELPLAGEVDLVLVDWSERRDGWAERLGAWATGSDAPRIILFGRHTDLEAHADARAAGLGPMWARSKLVAEADRLLAGDDG